MYPTSNPFLLNMENYFTENFCNHVNPQQRNDFSWPSCDTGGISKRKARRKIEM